MLTERTAPARVQVSKVGQARCGIDTPAPAWRVNHSRRAGKRHWGWASPVAPPSAVIAAIVARSSASGSVRPSGDRKKVSLKMALRKPLGEAASAT